MSRGVDNQCLMSIFLRYVTYQYLRARRSLIWGFFKNTSNYDITREVFCLYQDCLVSTIIQSWTRQTSYHPDDAYEQYLQAKEAAAVFAAQSRSWGPSRRPDEEEGKTLYTNELYLMTGSNVNVGEQPPRRRKRHDLTDKFLKDSDFMVGFNRKLVDFVANFSGVYHKGVLSVIYKFFTSTLLFIFIILIV